MLALQIELPSAVTGRGEPGLGAHHDHRTVGVVHAVSAHRTHQHAREAPVTMATHDEQVGVACRVKKYRRGLALYCRGLHGYIRQNPRALLLPTFLAAASPRLRNPFWTSPVQCRRSSGSARPPPHAAWHRWRGRTRRPNAARSGTGGTHRRPRRQEMWILLTCQFTASVTSRTTLPCYPIP